MHIPQEMLTTLAVSIFASTGFWTFLNNVYQNRKSKKSIERAALLGLLHENLMKNCDFYVTQGHITVQEYEDLEHYIYKPYRDLGGNGTGERAWQEVNKLPLKG